MSLRASRGCLPCRRRKVKCDQGRPYCEKCTRRNEVCKGYRDDSMLVFRNENEKTTRKALKRRASVHEIPKSILGASLHPADPSLRTGFSVGDNLTERWNGKPREMTFHNSYPWLKSTFTPTGALAEDQAVSRFFEKYVMYPCNHSSSPGFLEHLPSLFEEVKYERRVALRWAVRAAGYASLANEQNSKDLRCKARECYGLALSALGESLTDPKSSFNDLTLMAVLLLDMFEAIFLPDSESRGSHVDGMAQILRLRGHKQFYDTRGWTLLRLAHHRLQKQQLTFQQGPIPQLQEWTESLNDDLAEVGIEHENLQISHICERARQVRAKIGEMNMNMAKDQVLELIDEMHSLDQTASKWRSSPGWDFRTMRVSDLAFVEKDKLPTYPDFIQIHPDVWIAYEWNYHRTARIILHNHLLECLARLAGCSTMSDAVSDQLESYKTTSIDTITRLVDEVLSTAPQSLGDIGQTGTSPHGLFSAPNCVGVGGYFLLWPIRIIKSNRSATARQRATAEVIFERIRQCTGVESALGDSSKV